MNKLFLSIIIPAYNEEARLPGSLEKITTFLAQQPYRTKAFYEEYISAISSHCINIRQRI